MEGTTTIDLAKKLFGVNFIGPDEIKKVSFRTNISDAFNVPDIPFSEEFLKTVDDDDFILILGIDSDKSGNPLTINSMRDFYGVDPSLKEPCFYNQDWYLNEDFANKVTLENKWYLIRKNVLDDTKGRKPEEIDENLPENEQFPSAVLTAHTFFLYYFLNNGEKLWKNDFIWCSDTDHNGDRIYTGRYIDPTGINKNGFNIHRFLSLSPSFSVAPQIK